jgi:branched-chain amino acid transport system substrate-binding protein
MQNTGAKKFYCPSADYIWPRIMNQKLRDVASANGGSIVGEEYFPLDHADYGSTVEKILSSGADVVFNTTVPPAVAPFLEQLHNSGFTKRGGHIVCTYFEENFVGLVPAAHVEGLYSCLDYYQNVDDPFSRELLAQYNKLYPGGAKFTAGSASTGMYRGLKLWEAAVKEAGSINQDHVIRALDHAKIAQGPGGPAEMVPGQHHVRMNMYLARVKNRQFEIVKNFGVIDPKECVQSK